MMQKSYFLSIKLYVPMFICSPHPCFTRRWLLAVKVAQVDTTTMLEFLCFRTCIKQYLSPYQMFTALQLSTCSKIISMCRCQTSLLASEKSYDEIFNGWKHATYSSEPPLLPSERFSRWMCRARGNVKCIHGSWAAVGNQCLPTTIQKHAILAQLNHEKKTFTFSTS